MQCIDKFFPAGLNGKLQVVPKFESIVLLCDQIFSCLSGQKSLWRKVELFITPYKQYFLRNTCGGCVGVDIYHCFPKTSEKWGNETEMQRLEDATRPPWIRCNPHCTTLIEWAAENWISPVEILWVEWKIVLGDVLFGLKRSWVK